MTEPTYRPRRKVGLSAESVLYGMRACIIAQSCLDCGDLKMRSQFRTNGDGPYTTCNDCMSARRGREYQARKGREINLSRVTKLRSYSLTMAEYEQMWVTQGGACAICRRPAGNLVVDHNHDCCPGPGSCGSCVRGLLCSECNAGLGMFRDNADLMKRAAIYAEKGIAA